MIWIYLEAVAAFALILAFVFLFYVKWRLKKAWRLRKLYEQEIEREMKEWQTNVKFSRERWEEIRRSFWFLGRIIVVQENSFSGGSITLVQYENGRYFLTAKHIFEDEKTGHISQGGQALIEIQNMQLTYPISDFYFDSQHDLAILPCDKDLLTDCMLVDNLHIEPAQTIFAYGFPFNNFLASEGMIERIREEFIWHTAKTWQGSSGGPLIIVHDGWKFLAGIHLISAFEIMGVVFRLRMTVKKFSQALSYQIIIRGIKKFKNKSSL